MAAMISRRSVDVTPDKSLIEKLGNVGFTPEEALAEFVDNSIDALYDNTSGKRLVDGAAEVEVLLSPSSITIADTSAGIADFDKCMVAAWSQKTSGVALGQFGLGMKTASMSLGRSVTIESKRLGESVEHKISLDLDEWYKTSTWRLEIEDKQAPLNAHFTRIRIEKLLVDPLLYVRDLRDELADRFGPLILEGDVSIRVDGKKVVPTPVEFLDEGDQSLKRAIKDLGLTSFSKRKEFEFTVDGRKVTGWVDILEKRSLSGKFGFHIFRGRRLIQAFVKVGIRDHPNHANLFGHLYLPFEFPIAFTKNRIEWRGREALKADLESVCADHRRVAQKMASKEAPVVHPKLVQDVKRSLDLLAEAIKESPFVTDLAESERKRALQKDAEGLGPVDSERRAPRLNKSATRPIPRSVRARNPLPGRPRQRKDWWFIRVGKFELKLFHDWIEMDEPKMWYSTYSEDRSPPELLVQTNITFDSYQATTDKMFYATGNVIMALARIISDLGQQTGRGPTDPMEIQEDLYLRWGKRMRRGFASGVGSSPPLS
jgi:histidine kinase/DNA gyrase B/HSP90-like ATPase